MRYRVLGTLEVQDDDGEPVRLGSAQQRRLLAALLLHSGEVASDDRLLEIIWGEDQPQAGVRALRTVVSRLRSVLDGDSIETKAPGYALTVGPGELDAAEFEREVTEGKRLASEGDPVGALAALDPALAAFRGRAYAEFADEAWAQPEVARLDELRRLAATERIEARLQLGAHREVVVELETFIAEEPLREEQRVQLMLALYRSGRQADALRAFHDYRDYLAEETGLEPSVELVELEAQILARDPLLDFRERGQTLRGYELGEPIGEGAFGRVYRATQPGVGREVAIKVVRPELADDVSFIRRFEAEAQLVAGLEHPHIVPLYDYWREPGGAYLVMRWVRGGSADEALDRDGPWPLDRVARLVEEIGSALALAHDSGVVHRDVKPANILLDDSGNSYLSDFGIAVGDLHGDAQLELLSAGAPLYASPEQIRGDPWSARSDLYSFGLIIYELLTGRAPFEADSVQQLMQMKLSARLPSVSHMRPDVPASVDAVLQQVTSPNPAKRFTDAAAFVLAFRAAVNSPFAPPPAPGETGERPASRTTLVSLDVDRANPYKGLRAFAEADAQNFFGRDVLIERLVAEIGSSRFVAVVGASGSGKSSLVRAGVVPKLRAQGALVVTMIPGTHPLDELETALLRVARDPIPSLLEQLTADERGISRAIKRVLPENGELVLVVDQFEELFTFAGQRQREGFLDGLAVAVHDRRSALRLIATLRADLSGRALAHPIVGTLLQDHAVLLPPLSANELARAITGPAERISVSIEPALAAELVVDSVGNPGSLPLLQYALAELYERRDGTTMTLDSYRDIGGIAGALARKADELYATLAADGDQSEVRRLFTRLITPGEGTEDTRRRVRRSELASVTEETIDVYGEARLLTFDVDPSTREPTVEVAHEALIQRWPRLRRWIDEDRDLLRLMRHLSEAAVAWDRLDRDPGELYRGGRLASALEVEDRLELAAVERDFLDASRRERDADEKRKARANRRLRRALAGVAVALALAIAAGLVVLVQQRRADERARAAELQVFLAVAQDVPDGEREFALLLVVEADRRIGNIESRGAVFDALRRDDRFRGTITGSFDSYDAIAVAPGSPLIAGISGTSIELFDINQRVRLDVDLPQPSSSVGSEAFQSGGFISLPDIDVAAITADAGIAAVISEGQVTLTTLSSGEQIPFQGPEENAIAVAFDRSEDLIAITTELVDTHVYDVPSGELVTTIPGIVNAGAFSPDGRFVATRLGALATFSIWEVATGAPTPFEQQERFDPRTLISVGFGPLAGQLLTSHANGSVRLWDIDTGEVVQAFSSEIPSLRKAAFSPDGALVARGLIDGSVTVWHVETGAVIGEPILPTPGDRGIGVGFVDDRTIVTVGAEVSIWELDGRSLLTSAIPNGFGDAGIVLHPTRPMAAAARSDGIVAIVDAFDPSREITRLSDPVSTDPKTMAFSPDGELLVVATLSELVAYDATTWEPISTVTLTGDMTAISVANNRLAAVNTSRFQTGRNALSPGLAFVQGGSVQEVDLDAGEIRHLTDRRPIATRYIPALTGLALTPDGSRLAATTPDGRAGVWDLESGEFLDPDLEEIALNVSTVTFDPSGELMVTGSNDGSVSFREAATGAVLATTVAAHRGIVVDAQFSADGSQLLTSGRDGSYSALGCRDSTAHRPADTKRQRERPGVDWR